MKIVISLLLLSSLGLSQLLDRPPQYVLVSFDGSKSTTFWKETFSLGNLANARFSYFISGIYFLQQKDRLTYSPPKHKPGSSDIGFAVNDVNDIQQRTKDIWKAVSDIHPHMEIGSHVNGHFDGALWTYEEWTQEFNEFYKLIGKVFNFYPTMNTSFKADWETMILSEIKGFRAPLLAGKASITAVVMKDFRYTYDAGQVLKNKWPYKMTPELWNIGLSRIAVAGTTRETIAMDYNILYGQCNGVFSPTNSGECKDVTEDLLVHYEKQTYDSYVQAFLKNYYGNRAPLSIGHHFSLWNKGIYWKALQRFVLEVCQLPEVKCVTHIELADWMESQSVRWGDSFFNRMNQGLFSKVDTPSSPQELLMPLPNSPQLDNLEPRLVAPKISKASEKVMLKGDLPQAHDEISADIDMSKFRIER